MRKTNVFTAAALAMAMTLTACSSSGSSTTTTAAPQSAAETTAAAETKGSETAETKAGETGNASTAPATATSTDKVTINISDSYTEMDQVNKELNTAAENINKRTNGNVEVKVFANNSFGNMADGVEAINSNSPLMLCAAFSQFDDIYPDGSALQCAFVFDQGEEFLRFMNTDTFKKVVTEMDKVNVHPLNCSFIGGMRQVIGKKAYKTPDDMKGLKIRVPASTPYLECFQALGANPIGMAASEQLQALSAGTVDALDQSISLIYSTKSYELANQVTLLNQMCLADSLFCSTTWWNSLPEDYQAIIEDELNQAGNRYYDYSVENESKMREEMEGKGVVFNEIDREPFIELGKNLINQYSIGPEVKETVEQIRKDIAAGK